MNTTDHISQSLETIFWVKKILKFFDADPDPDPGSGISMIRDGKIRIRDKLPGSATLYFSKVMNSDLHGCALESVDSFIQKRA
jgi:hypothetical protein